MPEGQGYDYDVALDNGTTVTVTLDSQPTPEQLASPEFLEALRTNMAPQGGPFVPAVPDAKVSEIQPPPDEMNGVVKAIPENIGGTAGELIGTPAGPVGRIVGQFTGGAIGRMAAESQDEMSATDRLKSGAVAGAEQVVGGEGLRIAGKLAGKAYHSLRPRLPFMTRQLDAETADAWKFFADFADPVQTGKMRGLLPHGDVTSILTPGDALQSHGLQTLENIARGSILSGESMQNVEKNAAVAADRALEEIIREYGPSASREDIGKTIQLAISDRERAADLATKPVYNAIADATSPKPVQVLKEIEPAKVVDTGVLDSAGNPVTRIEPPKMGMVEEMRGGVRVDLSRARKHAQAVADIARDLNSVAGGAAGDDLAKRLSSIDDLPFPEVQELRSRLLFLQRQAARAELKTTATNRLGRLIKDVDGAMDRALREQAPEWHGAWRKVNQVYKQNTDIYQNRLINQLMRLGKRGSIAGTEDFAEVFQQGRVKGVDRLFTAIKGDAEAEMFGRQVFLNKILTEAQKDGVLDGAKLADLLDRDTAYKASFDRAFPVGDRNRIRTYARRLSLIQRPRMSTRGTELLQYGQLTALVGLAAGKVNSSTAAIVMTPAIAARIFSSPATQAMMLGTLKVPVATKAGLNLSRRLTAEIVKQSALDAGEPDPALPEP